MFSLVLSYDEFLSSLLWIYLRLVHFAYLSNSFTSWTNSTKEIAKKIQNFGCILNNGKLVMMGFGILVYKGKRKYEKRVILSKSLMRELGEKLRTKLQDKPIDKNEDFSSFIGCHLPTFHGMSNGCYCCRPEETETSPMPQDRSERVKLLK